MVPPNLNTNVLPVLRNRLAYAAALPVLIACGVLWRSRLFPLPAFAAKYGGDLLWALLVFVLCGVVFNRSSTLRLGVLALSFAWAIEFSQMYHAPWIDAIRATRVGHLVLGSTFNAPDLVAYLAGIGLGMGLEVLLQRRLVHPRNAG